MRAKRADAPPGGLLYGIAFDEVRSGDRMAVYPQSTRLNHIFLDTDFIQLFRVKRFNVSARVFPRAFSLWRSQLQCVT